MKSLITATLIFLSLAFEAQAQVPASARALIVVAELDSTGIPELAPLYNVLEDVTIGIPALPGISNSYGRIVNLRNGSATMAQFRAQARLLAAQPGIQAIDVIMALHGRDNRLRFRDDTVNMEELQDFMLQGDPALVTSMRRKFRLMYNTSCFGASHRTAMRNVGFDVVIGAVGVNANSEAEYPSFLALWNAGNSVSVSMAPTNNPVTLAITDGPLVATGNFLNNFLRNVNSRKVFSGNTAVRIMTPAL